MREVKAAAVQMRCVSDAASNLQTAERLIRQAAAEGAQIILLPELFERPYFCQERQYGYYQYARTAEENAAVARLSALARELRVVLPVSFYERDGNRLYNSAAILDADGSLLGVYRKTHIPDDHYYQEKFYFTPGNTGFRVWNTRYARIGVGICWDAMVSRNGALSGAQRRGAAALPHRHRLGAGAGGGQRRPLAALHVQGHAAANIVPVLAANRFGVERVEPSPENGGQRSELTFYGSSFIADETGALLAAAGRDGEAVLCASFDLDALSEKRLEWGLYRDRRPACYTDITAE